MALPTYLDLVNDVLVRLREPPVGAVNENNLSALVGKFINDAKRQVEDAYNWNALSTTLTANTTSGIFNYSLVGTQSRFKVIEIYNKTGRCYLSAKASREMTQLFLGSDVSTLGIPNYYNFNGISSAGDTQVDLYPVPNGVYEIYFNLYIPQPDLALDSTKMFVPKEPVMLLAYARSLVERGEDGGLNSSEAYSMYKSSLSDAISLEASRYPEEECWTWG